MGHKLPLGRLSDLLDMETLRLPLSSESSGRLLDGLPKLVDGKLATSFRW